MTAVRDAVATVRAALAALVQRATSRTGARTTRGDARARAICPTDAWTFTPLYTNGSCPLCGWVPDGYVYKPPLLTPYERYWGALAGIATLSVVMCIVVILASTQS